MDSSLSSVPPVCPKPRPEIIGTGTPAEATTGAKMSESLSPTPPVECLSTFLPFTWDKSTISPEWSIASVKAADSSSFIPFRKAAIKKALIW